REYARVSVRSAREARRPLADKPKSSLTRGGLGTRRAVRLLAMLAVAGALAIVAGAAYGQLEPWNALFALGPGGGQSPAAAPVAHRAEPPLVATPLVPCGPEIGRASCREGV